MRTLFVHNNESMLHYVASKQDSADVVGANRRKILASAVADADPFSFSREPVQDFTVASTGSPFGKFSLADAEAFVRNAKANYCLRFGPSMVS